MRQIEIRGRDNGGEWSDWVAQDDATPIYVDGADEAQVRAPFKPDGELHFVNVSGTSGGPVDRLLTTARQSINEAFIAIASTLPHVRFVTYSALADTLEANAPSGVAARAGSAWTSPARRPGVGRHTAQPCRPLSYKDHGFRESAPHAARSHHRV